MAADTAGDLPVAARPGDPVVEVLRRALERAPEGPARRWLERLLRDGQAAAGPAAPAADPTRNPVTVPGAGPAPLDGGPSNG